MFRGVRFASQSVRSETHRRPLRTAECKQDNGIELTSDTVKERIAIALFNDYKFIRKNKDNLIEQIAVITQLDKKTIDSIRKKHISE